MPENKPLTPSDITVLAHATGEAGTLALLTVKLLNQGKVEEAKEAAALCDIGRGLLAATLSTLSPEERTSVARAIKEHNEGHAKPSTQDQ